MYLLPLIQCSESFPPLRLKQPSAPIFTISNLIMKYTAPKKGMLKVWRKRKPVAFHPFKLHKRCQILQRPGLGPAIPWSTDGHTETRDETFLTSKLHARRNSTHYASVIKEDQATERTLPVLPVLFHSAMFSYLLWWVGLSFYLTASAEDDGGREDQWREGWLRLLLALWSVWRYRHHLGMRTWCHPPHTATRANRYFFFF